MIWMIDKNLFPTRVNTKIQIWCKRMKMMMKNSKRMVFSSLIWTTNMTLMMTMVSISRRTKVPTVTEVLISEVVSTIWDPMKHPQLRKTKITTLKFKRESREKRGNSERTNWKKTQRDRIFCKMERTFWKRLIYIIPCWNPRTLARRRSRMMPRVRDQAAAKWFMRKFPPIIRRSWPNSNGSSNCTQKS